MQDTAEFTCGYCGEPNLTFIDLSAGGQQSYVEDCQVCCRPNILYVRVDEDTLEIEIDTEYEGWTTQGVWVGEYGQEQEAWRQVLLAPFSVTQECDRICLVCSKSDRVFP